MSEETVNFFQPKNDFNLEINVFPFDMLKIFRNNSFVQLVGASGSGKTTISLQIALSYCKLNKKVVYIDANGFVTQEQLKSFGLLPFQNKLFFLTSINSFDTLENILDDVIANEKIDLIVIDSIAALVNEGYLNLKRKGRQKGISITNNNTNYDSRPLNLFIRKYKAIANSFEIHFLLVNDFRNKISMPKGTIEKRFGVKAVDTASTSILELLPLPSTIKYKKIKDIFKPLTNGKVMSLKIVKSDNCTPNLIIPIFLEFGHGISLVHAVLYYVMVKKQSFKTLSVTGVEQLKSAIISEFLKYKDDIYDFYLKE